MVNWLTSFDTLSGYKKRTLIATLLNIILLHPKRKDLRDRTYWFTILSEKIAHQAV